ncbi:MAG: MGMT family protein [Planctomycetota bacterium]
MPLRDEYTGILRVVQAIPPGHVMTYGQVAKAAGLLRRARWVGKVLAGLPADSDIPWHRVVNAAGRVSLCSDAAAADQRRRLEGEGVTFDPSDRVDLAVYAFRPSRSTGRGRKRKD